ncbi:MAG TPA: sulfur carrier protein ThiS adenylyltransferase ThiF [Lachnospiraceae bacterium]|nr:thiamine biosynthesis protein ThiF [Eubacterium sp.]HBZ02898.1 sulfur carrier protein ThiS adenylyltransferase ThiF [Lachnospiraceae bacterium]
MIPTRAEWEGALIDRHGEERQRAFLNATVAVCGLGGLGSNIATALTRAGIGKLILIDFDKVDITNLNRQQYKMKQLGMDKTEAMSENLREISPYTDIETHTVKLYEGNIPELLAEADIICEAFDKADQKSLLVNTVLETFPDKYIISGSGMAGFESANMIQTRKSIGKLYVCGDGKSDVNDGIGLVASRVMVCAAHEAHIVLRILSGELEV